MRALGVDVLVANELLEDRAEIFKQNFPDCEMISGDIRLKKNLIIETAQDCLSGRNLDVLFATPPCQGMSKNGRGKLLSGIRAGLKPELDERNQLIVHAVEIAKALKPKLILFENVPEMENTIIEVNDGQYKNILDYLREELSPSYVGSAAVVEFADYGVPQRRQRLITVFSRTPKVSRAVRGGEESWLSPQTHSKTPTLLQKKWVAVEDVIGHLPPLDARDETSAKSHIEHHRVPLLDEEKYFWVSNTPLGKGAFDNQCVNPACRYDSNPVHGSTVCEQGINSSNKTTPVRCISCGNLLPRPWVRNGDNYKIMSGFTSAYKRMRGDLPASALTRNLSYACSDQKLHPTQNRVLSLYEAFIIHTISDYEYVWKRADRKKVSDKSIREIIGESIPPKGLEHAASLVIKLLKEDAISENYQKAA